MKLNKDHIRPFLPSFQFAIAVSKILKGGRYKFESTEKRYGLIVIFYWKTNIQLGMVLRQVVP